MGTAIRPIRFNTLVRVFGAIIWFLIGAALVIGLLLLGSFYSPFAWMPIAFAAIFAGWLGTLPMVRERALAWPIGIALLVAVTDLWVRSQGLLVVGWQQQTPRKLLLTWALALAVAAVGLTLVWLTRMRGMKPKLGWLAILLLMSLVVTLASSSAASAGRMVHFFMTYFHWDQATADRMVVIIRKSIHVGFYGLVGFVAWRAALQAGSKRTAAFVFAIGAALILACFDELRQSTQPGRGSSIWDVLLDMCGCGVALGIAYLAGLRKGPRAVLQKRTQ